MSRSFFHALFLTGSLAVVCWGCATTEEAQRDQLFDAAVLLAKNGPDNVSNQAVQMLGAIGGAAKAEPVLLEMLDTAPENKVGIILNALANIGSKKARGIILKFLLEGPEQKAGAAAGALGNNRCENLFEKADVELLEKALAKYPPNSDHGNNRYLRECILRVIFRLDQDRGVDILCAEMSMPTRPDFRRSSFHIANDRQLSFESWKKILKAAGDPNLASVDMLTQILYHIGRTGDWRVTDLILPWADIAKSNPGCRQAYMEALIQLRDPKAAKTLLDLLPGDRAAGRLDGYPGIKKEDAGKYVLADDAEMRKLLDARDKRIADFEAAAKKAAGAAKE